MDWRALASAAFHILMVVVLRDTENRVLLSLLTMVFPELGFPASEPC